MSVDPRQVAQVLFEALGIGQPSGDLTDAESFHVDDALCRITRAPSGTEVLLSIEVGTLTQEPFAAADRLRRLMRSSLGLAVVNRAVLRCDNPPDEIGLRALQSGLDGAPVLRFSAVARIEGGRRDEIIGALQDILQLRTLALQHLTAADTGSDDSLLPPLPARPSQREEDGGSFLIFQP